MMGSKNGFRRSSFCGGGDCVEVETRDGGWVAVRDSKQHGSAEHVFTPQEWASFVRGVKAGEFDFGLPLS